MSETAPMLDSLLARLRDLDDNELPDDLHDGLMAAGDAAIAPLVAIMTDQPLLAGSGWAPMFAALVLTELRAEAAIPSMAQLLATTDFQHPVHEELAENMADFGAAALEPLLAAHATCTVDDNRLSITAVLAGLGVRDPRILAAIGAELAGEYPAMAAEQLAAYGDPAGAPLLARALDAYQVDPGRLADSRDDLGQLAIALEQLGGEPTAAQRRKLIAVDDALAAHREASVARAQGRMPTPSVVAPWDPPSTTPARRVERPGRNEPCWCGSGTKYKKCHLAADESKPAKS